MKTKRHQGFTLIEILTVIIIIGILTGILLPVVTVVRTRVRVAATKADIAAYGTAAEAFKSDADIYPPDQFYVGSYVVDLPPSMFRVILSSRYPCFRITGEPNRIVKDPANDSTRGLPFWLGGAFSIQGKIYSPYMIFKQNRLVALTPTQYYPNSGTTNGVRWSVVGTGPVQSNGQYLVYAIKDWFDNNYVYDSHAPECKQILAVTPGPNGASSDAHNLTSFDMYSFGPTYSVAADGTLDDYDNPPPYPGEAADDINNWQ